MSDDNYLGFSFLQKDKNDIKKCIGYFLLELYHKNYFGYNGNIEKRIIRIEYEKYKKRENLNEIPEYNENIGTILRQNDFLFNTKRGCDHFCIHMSAFRDFQNNLLKEMDDTQIQKLNVLPKEVTEEIKENLELNFNDDEKKVEFQKGTIVQIDKHYYLTTMGCFICQQNFEDQEKYENHLEEHGESTGFQSISDYSIIQNTDLQLSYRTCINNYLLCFTMKTNRKDIIIEKIIIVQARWMSYARNEDVPFDFSSSGIEHFFVDSHLFNVGVPQPIVIVYRYQGELSSRNIAQYLFMRHEDFPVLKMKLKSTRVISRDELKVKGQVPFYYPSATTLALFSGSGFTDEDVMMAYPKMRQYLEEGKELKSSNMVEVFKILLEMEDVEIDKEYKKLNREGCEIKGYCGEYSVTIKNVVGNTNVADILNPFDEVRLTAHKVKNSDNDDNFVTTIDKNGKKRRERRKFWFYVHRVYGSKVCFRPMREKNRGKNIQLDMKYDVQFSPGRMPIRYQYHALDILSKRDDLRKFLLPTHNFNKTPSNIPLEFYNEQIEKNPEQKQAVMNIADGPNNSAPYLIFGPPGTGKTTTIVESIYQLWKINPFNKILVTAGSNAACDEVGRKLCEIFNDIDPEGLNLLRIYAAAVEKRMDNMDENLLEASNLCHNYHFYPSIDSICRYRIIVATLTVVGKLVFSKLNEGTFTHIFIDECAASTEPESLVGIAGLLSNNTRLILSGDPKQLGPILKCKKAADLGLNQSLMERLLKRKCYEVTTENNENYYDKSIQTRLIRNFRTHSNILFLSNTLYYQDELKCCAHPERTNIALDWHRLPRKKFPIIFNVVYGDTRKDKESTSLCNYKELSVTMDYVKNLMFYGIKDRKLTENDIGIISPYKKQCNLIRDELDKRKWYKIEVGSVETFQGKEKPIIIISMVRSKTPTIGFLDNPKRLNVTLTRAQALMIIIGNPETLEKYHDWKEVIEYCKENSALTGAKYPRDQINNIKSYQNYQNSDSGELLTKLLNKTKGGQFDFKTSQSSLSTISNAQSQPQQKQKNSKRNNHRRRGFNHRNNRRNQNNQSNKNDDCISLSSNLEEVANWLEDTAKFREQKEKEQQQQKQSLSSSFQKLSMDDFEIIDNKLNLVTIHETEVNKNLNSGREWYNKNNFNDKIINSNQNSLKDNNSNKPETIKQIQSTNEKPPMPLPRVTLPQQPIRSSHIIRPMSSSSTNSMTYSGTNQSSTTSPLSNRPQYPSSSLTDKNFGTNQFNVSTTRMTSTTTSPFSNRPQYSSTSSSSGTNFGSVQNSRFSTSNHSGYTNSNYSSYSSPKVNVFEHQPSSYEYSKPEKKEKSNCTIS